MMFLLALICNKRSHSEDIARRPVEFEMRKIINPENKLLILHVKGNILRLLRFTTNALSITQALANFYGDTRSQM